MKNLARFLESPVTNAAASYSAIGYALGILFADSRASNAILALLFSFMCITLVAGAFKDGQRNHDS